MNYKPNKSYYKPQRYAIDFNVVNKWLEELEALQPGEFELEWRDLDYAMDMIVITGNIEYSIRMCKNPTIVKTGEKIYAMNPYESEKIMKSIVSKYKQGISSRH